MRWILRSTAAVICPDEFLIDLVSQKKGATLTGIPGFRKAAGGAPVNVAIGLARLETSSALITKLGQDSFDEFFYSILKENRVETWGRNSHQGLQAPWLSSLCDPTENAISPSIVIHARTLS